MEESTIIVHWGEYDRSKEEIYAVTNFPYMFDPSWLQSDFARFCIEEIDKCKYLGGILIDSPWLGPIPPERLSGGTQTLLIAYNRKDLFMPLRNLGDNCAEAIYRSGIGTPSKWMWLGYMPTILDNQRILIESTGEVVMGHDWYTWSEEHAPDIADLVPMTTPYVKPQ